jgi:hypothetical protein
LVRLLQKRPENPSIHITVLLDETDNLTTALIKRLLKSGVQQLPQLQREIIDSLFLQKLKAPKRYFRDTRQMSGQEVDNQLAEALHSLRNFFEKCGISGLHDIL